MSRPATMDNCCTCSPAAIYPVISYLFRSPIAGFDSTSPPNFYNTITIEWSYTGAGTAGRPGSGSGNIVCQWDVQAARLYTTTSSVSGQLPGTTPSLTSVTFTVTSDTTANANIYDDSFGGGGALIGTGSITLSDAASPIFAVPSWPAPSALIAFAIANFGAGVYALSYWVWTSTGYGTGNYSLSTSPPSISPECFGNPIVTAATVAGACFHACGSAGQPLSSAPCATQVGLAFSAGGGSALPPQINSVGPSGSSAILQSWVVGVSNYCRGDMVLTESDVYPAGACDGDGCQIVSETCTDPVSGAPTGFWVTSGDYAAVEIWSALLGEAFGAGAFSDCGSNCHSCCQPALE